MEIFTDYYLKLPVLNRRLCAMKLFLGLPEISSMLQLLIGNLYLAETPAALITQDGAVSG